MLDARTSRLATLCVLVAILAVLAVWFGLPTPGLYLSTDIWPSLVTGGLALGVWILVRRADHSGTTN